MVVEFIDQEEPMPMRDRSMGGHSMRDGSRRRSHLSMIQEGSTNREFDDVDAADMESQGSNADSVDGMTRRRSAALFSLREQKLRQKLLDEMQHVRVKLGDTYQVEDEKILLHGYLHIQIIRAKGLRNADLLKAIFYNPLMCNFKCDEASDSYVTVHAGADRLLKTRVIDDDLNPEWNQDFYLPVCHHIKELEFRVKDWDDFGSEDLGEYRLSVHELIHFGIDEDDQVDISVSMQMSESIANFNANANNNLKIPTKIPAQRLLRRGVHKTVFLDGRPSHGSLEFTVDFIPKDLLHKPPRALGVLTQKSPITMEVPGVYFPPRKNNRVRFYINADDKGTAPQVTYYPNGNGKTTKVWKPRRFFRDIYDSWCAAKHLIYVVGWSVDYTISLLRGQEEYQGLNLDANGNPYSPKIGELLNQKANEGVVVNMLVWDDNTSNTFKTEGAVATRDEELRQYFKDSKVNLRLVPMGAGDANMFKKFRNSVYYTHHQKCVICDTPQKELVAYVGGIDLTYGRYEDGTYPLFRTLDTDHKDDFHQACFDVSQENGPREPWHDIHSRVKGEGTLDLLKNFNERWLGQGGLVKQLVVLEDFGISTHPDVPLEEDEENDWNTQLFRSIDARTAQLKEPEYKIKTFEETKGVKFEEAKTLKGGKRSTLMQSLLKTGPEREQHFSGDSQSDLVVSRPLEYKRDLKIDASVHQGLVHHIRNAQHSIYIESQYFLSSSFFWCEDATSKCCNLIAAEITFKICEKIEAGERFAAYIVLPMWPEGIPDSSSVQDILNFQGITMKSMYKRIQLSIDRQKQKLQCQSPLLAKKFADITPNDYLNFYCLANREEAQGGPVGTGLLNKTRRHLVYTHSKMTIVDDAIVICGSANINQRSMDGNRDSELLMGSWQPKHLATRESVAQGDVHGFRLHCWAHLTGTMEDVYRRPQSLECVRRINQIANRNWQLFSQDEVVEMTSYLTTYPIKVERNGDVVPATTNGKFPDTQANILGSSKPSLPKFLTT